MKTTLYFEDARQRPDLARIRLEWIQQVIDCPERIAMQSDGRIRKWAKIVEEEKLCMMPFLTGHSERKKHESEIFR
jgi:hypothetical protein